jgi:hypothetical protein
MGCLGIFRDTMKVPSRSERPPNPAGGAAGVSTFLLIFSLTLDRYILVMSFREDV